jgi:hypothetical protein
VLGRDVIGRRLVGGDRNETGGRGKKIENGKGGKGGRMKERERDELDELMCFVRCCCDGGEMRFVRGGNCGKGKRMPRTLYKPTETVTMSAYPCQIDSEQRKRGIEERGIPRQRL